MILRKFLCVIISFCFIKMIYAEHINFFGAEMGTHPDLFKEALKHNFKQSDEDDYIFYGYFLGVECRLIIEENQFKNSRLFGDNREVSQLTINYNHPQYSKYARDYTLSEADSLQKNIVKSLCNMFSSQGHEVYLSGEHPLANNGGRGTLIILRDGLISVITTKSLGENKNRYMIWLRIYDYENNILFLNSQEYNNTLIEKSKLNNKSTKKNRIRKRKKNK